MREVGTPEGTSIEVADLFYNLPARRKFLKSDTAESAQVSRIVTQLALGYPEVGFTLTSARPEGARVSAGRVACAIGCIQLYGDRDDLIEVRQRGRRRDRSTASSPRWREQGPTRGPQNVFVNRRIVKDRTIAHAIIDAYSVASIKERSPEVHLFIEMPPDRGRRERASDEGGGAVSRAVAHPRSGSPRARRCARAAAARPSCSSRPLGTASGQTAARHAHSRRARRRHVSEPLDTGPLGLAHRGAARLRSRPA